MGGNAQPDFEVAVVGAGFSGIGTAIKLDEAGIRDWVAARGGRRRRRRLALEHLPGHRRRHPLVQLPVLLRAALRLVARLRPGRELKAYAEDCVDRYGLRSRIRLEHEGHRRDVRRRSRTSGGSRSPNGRRSRRATSSARPASSPSPSRPTSPGSTTSPAP